MRQFHDEAGRLAELHHLQVLDTEKEPVFDHLVKLAADHYDCPMAFMTLVDEARCWFKACHGFEIEQLEREVSFSADAITRSEVTLYQDLTANAETRDSPLVQCRRAPLRFYAAAPITSSAGFRLGAVSVCDTKPREFELSDLARLEDLATIAGRILELRKASRDFDRLAFLAQEAMAVTGEDFPRWLVRHLSDAIGLDRVFVGALAPGQDRIVTTQAAWADGREVPNFTYDLSITPCRRVMGEGICIETSGVQDRYPEDVALVEHKIEGYAGVVLKDDHGRLLGILAGLTKQPITDTELVESTLRLFAPRAAAELQRRRYEEQLHLMVAGTATKVGPELFDAITEHLANTLGVSCTFVSELLPGMARVRSLSLYCQGEHQSPVEYDLAGSPCARVYEASPFLQTKGVRDAFTNTPLSEMLDTEGFLAVVVRDSQGEPIGHVGVAHHEPLLPEIEHDPSLAIFAARAGAEIERRNSEESRLAAERALAEREKIASLGSLAGGVAHDLNNLLVAILGNCSLASEEAPESSPVREYVREIESATRQAADLAKQMLAYSGRGTFEVRPVDMTSLIGEVLQTLRTSMSPRVEFHKSLAEALPAVVCDAVQIRQVAMNLVLNGADAVSEQGGSVSLRTGLRTVHRRELDRAVIGGNCREGEYVYLEVADDGDGMEEETMTRIFDPYFSTKRQGRGLGLAAVQGIVRGHDGILMVTSCPGRGTNFELLLPAVDAVVEETHQLDSDSVWTNCGRVLLVDDEARVRQVTREMLERVGVEVATAENGAKALELFGAEPDSFDCVLLDVNMPTLDGPTTLRRIRQLRPAARVVFMSGYPESHLSGGVSLTEADAFLQKPFDLEQLAQELSRVLVLER